MAQSPQRKGDPVKIAHFAPFAPHQCGLYETVRDMIRAERLEGHVAELVDIGIDGARAVGKIDDRPGCLVRAHDYHEVKAFDIFVSNTSIPETFIEATKAPIVQVAHGRPESSFRLSQKNPEKHPVYALYYSRARRDRWRKFVTLWPEHVPYLSVLIPPEKIMAVEAPCDTDIHAPAGPTMQFKDRGSINFLVADIWRDDADPYFIAHALICSAAKDADFKVHFCAVRTPLGPWDYILRKMKDLGILGDVYGHIRGLDHVLRAADVVATPHTIATRLVRESLACGTPVVAPLGNRFAQWTGSGTDPERMGVEMAGIREELRTNPASRGLQARQMADVFSLRIFGERIIRIYQEVLDGAA